MMMREPIPLKDILFVFGAWTLMIDSELCADLVSGSEIVLFDEIQVEIGRARLDKYLPSRNPKISAIAITVNKAPSDMKAVKFVAKT